MAVLLLSSYEDDRGLPSAGATAIDSDEFTEAPLLPLSVKPSIKPV